MHLSLALAIWQKVNQSYSKRPFLSQGACEGDECFKLTPFDSYTEAFDVSKNDLPSKLGKNGESCIWNEHSKVESKVIVSKVKLVEFELCLKILKTKFIFVVN